ncbi:MAG: chemotaxis-specific protein-glutamate methyltransferase CheB [Candidatus Binatia bacterium]
MRIAIVNDLAIAVEALRRTVRAIPGAAIAWVARDGAEAVAACARDRPDLVLMDLVMPRMDGVEATRQIMRASPCPVLVVTASVRGNVGKVYEALGYGALDAVATPRLGLGGGLEGASELRRKIEMVGALARDRALAPPVPAPSPPASDRAVIVPPLIAIGASTGGPRALAEILAALPADLPAAVAVVQHIDRLFAPGLARWLDRRTPLSVAPLTAPEALRAGHVWVAAGEGHLVVGDDLRLTLVPDPAEHLHCPSIDIFFASAAHRLPARGIGVLLTGMGRDGAHGLLALRRAGYHTIAQDEHSSVVWGMPRAGAEAGGAVEVLPLDQIGARILALLGGGARE